MKTVFYFMFAFFAMVFLFSGVLSQDTNLNQELHGLAVQPVDQEADLLESLQEETIDDLEAAAEHPDLIVVYPYVS